MDHDTYHLLINIGTCHRLLKDFANGVRSRVNVKSVTHWTDLHDIDSAFRLEEFVDAELVSGEAISWRLELTICVDRFIIESDVRRIHGNGQDVVAEVADRVYSTETECSTGILEVVRQLSNTYPI
jgi:hypothetical protein